MTREDLISAIYNDINNWSCPNPDCCGSPEEEGNTGECCLKCAERLLFEYEKEIIKKAYDKVLSIIREGAKNDIGRRITVEKIYDLITKDSVENIHNELVEISKQTEELIKRIEDKLNE